MSDDEQRNRVLAATEKQQSMAGAMQTLAEVPTGRSFRGVAYTIGLGPEYDEEAGAELLTGARSVEPEIRAERSGLGWGGDSGAVTLVLDAVDRFGGVGGGVVLAWASVRFACNRVAKLWRHLHEKEGLEPDMSVGAVGYLCLADLHDLVHDRFDGIVVVHAGDLMPDAGATIGHSGAGELFLYVFANAQASWVYLANSKGQLLHRSESGSIPRSFFWNTGGDWDSPPARSVYLAAGHLIEEDEVENSK